MAVEDNKLLKQEYTKYKEHKNTKSNSHELQSQVSGQ